MRNRLKGAVSSIGPTRTPMTLLGTSAVIVLAVLGGLGLRLGAPSSAPARISVAEVATSMVPLDFTPAETELFSKMPSGYSQSSCTPVNDSDPGVLAALDCTHNAHGGPNITRYVLYAGAGSLADGFQKVVNSNERNPIVVAPSCPGGETSPGGWHYNASPNVQAGSIVCGSFMSNGDAALTWTKIADLVLGAARGGDLNAVYQWWNQYA